MAMEKDFASEKIDKDIEPYPYVISIKKLIVLSTLTFGLFEIYWFYKQFKSFKAETKWGIIPWLLTLFNGVTCYNLFRRISSTIEKVDKKKKLEYFWLAVAYFMFLIVGRMPEPYFYTTVLSFLPLIPVQKAISFYWHKKLGKELGEEKFGGWNYVWAITGGLFILLVILAVIFPAPEV